MWINTSTGNEYINSLYSPLSRQPRQTSQIFDKKYIQDSHERKKILENYQKYLISIRLKKHKERVAKTKFMSRLARNGNTSKQNLKASESG